MEARQNREGEARGGGRRRAAGAWRVAVVLLAVLVALLLYSRGEMWSSPEQWQASGAGVFTALAIVLIMTASLTCGLTASYFLILTPLLFPPHWSALITTTGCVLGAACGYVFARFVGGGWAERFRGGRARRFLSTHSSFLALFGLRLAPSPHSIVNYAAGLAHIPPARFLIATLAAMGIKSYVYATAVHNAVGAGSAAGVVSAPVVLSLIGVAALSLVGHVLTRRYTALRVAPAPISNRLG
ncbi:MAG TPA: VTT domain-containing protein [Pyrinomonadaceae bacterium]|nr:VTT domain-containing protein [Pyrinomonadaceae bacterium]